MPATSEAKPENFKVLGGVGTIGGLYGGGRFILNAAEPEQDEMNIKAGSTGSRMGTVRLRAGGAKAFEGYVGAMPTLPDG